MPDLRKEIEAAIAAHPHNPGQAAIAVCLAIEDHTCLNGDWWDDDPEILKEIENARVRRRQAWEKDIHQEEPVRPELKSGVKTNA